MKFSLFLPVLFVVALFGTTAAPPACSSNAENLSLAAESSDQGETSSPSDNSVTIAGPLRSFLRMAGMRQKVSPPEVLPILARNVVLHGYQNGRPTEYLILLRRYYHQAKELGALAAADGSIHVRGCGEAESLLDVLGYRIHGECGHKEMTLVTADPQRAFLTIDSGFPLLDLEDALQNGVPFVYAYAGSTVPVLFAPSDWTALAVNDENNKDIVQTLLSAPDLSRLYWALSRMDPETSMVLKKDIGLPKLRPYASALDLYGSLFYIRSGALAVPGGRNAEKQWQDLVGSKPDSPAEFIPQLLKRDHGWLAAYFDAMARATEKQQERFVANQRFKRYYEAFRSPGLSPDATARFVFRPAPGLMVLVARMQWQANGDPYVPGSLQTWSEILSRKPNSKGIHELSKHRGEWRHADQLAEAMFAYSRVDTDTGPLQAYLCLSELDHRRPPEHRLSDQTVALMAEKFSDFSDQYLIFSEFPELTDLSITRFLTTAGEIDKISDHALRGNAMGTFQASVGLWQILARQGQIDAAHQNPSWQAMIKPFTKFSTPAQLFTAGRASIEEVFRAGVGPQNLTQDEMINALAGARQRTDGGQRMHLEMANRIRSVLEDQWLVSVDTLFALDDALRDSTHADTGKDSLNALAGELREFEMPRPIFTKSERTRWAAGTYNNRHTEGEMRTDVAKVINSQASLAQRESARGQLATFLRDTLVGMNYAYYEMPGSQVLHHNPLFVRSHDFSGDTVEGVEQLWQSARLIGAGSPAGGGAHLIGSLADLPYVLADAEQDFIAPDHVQALIWKQFVPGLMSSAIVPRWWDVSQNELHAVALYQRAGEELLTAASSDADLRVKVMAILSDRMLPARWAWLDQTIRTGKTKEVLDGVMPAETFYLAAEFRQRYPGDLHAVSAAGRELETLSNENPDRVSRERLSRDFGIIHPVFAQSYARELINVRAFPPVGGNYSRLMAECWDSGNLYWARLADEMGYSPVLLNRMVPELTRRMVEKIFASELEDWSAILNALQETGEEFRQGKISVAAGSVAAPVSASTQNNK
jgi:hypothetical protein